MGTFIIILLVLVVAGGVYWVIKKNNAIANEEMEKDPDIFNKGVKLCADEMLIKAYNCTQLKSLFLRAIKARGILTVTNKRVIFHTIGIKNNDDFIHDEVAIEDVSGISIQSGVTKDSVINIFAPVFSMLPGVGKRKKVFFMTIYSKGVSGEGAINIAPTDSKGTLVAVPSYDMIPTEIVVDMANEVGAIISDIQKLGDLGIEKWKK